MKILLVSAKTPPPKTGCVNLWSNEIKTTYSMHVKTEELFGFDVIRQFSFFFVSDSESFQT